MVLLTTNHPYLVEISAIATGALFGDTSLSAFVDPAFKIAPTVQDPADFTIAFSPILAAPPGTRPPIFMGFCPAPGAFGPGGGAGGPVGCAPPSWRFSWQLASENTLRNSG